MCYFAVVHSHQRWLLWTEADALPKVAPAASIRLLVLELGLEWFKLCIKHNAWCLRYKKKSLLILSPAVSDWRGELAGGLGTEQSRSLPAVQIYIIHVIEFGHLSS